MMSPYTKRKLREWLDMIFWTAFVIAFIYLIIVVRSLTLTS